jgi:hypothetical protein
MMIGDELVRLQRERNPIRCAMSASCTSIVFRCPRRTCSPPN